MIQNIHYIGKTRIIQNKQHVFEEFFFDEFILLGTGWKLRFSSSATSISNTLLFLCSGYDAWFCLDKLIEFLFSFESEWNQSAKIFRKRLLRTEHTVVKGLFFSTTEFHYSVHEQHLNCTLNWMNYFKLSDIKSQVYFICHNSYSDKGWRIRLLWFI